MPKFAYHPGVFSESECADFHERLLTKPYVESLGFSRTRYHFCDEVQPPSVQKTALNEMANLVAERVTCFEDFDSIRWKAAVNTWSCARIVGEPYMGSHRDDIGADVAAISLHGKGKFIVGKHVFDVMPGSVVVMYNKRLFPPKHDVKIESDERMSVALWRA